MSKKLAIVVLIAAAAACSDRSRQTESLFAKPTEVPSAVDLAPAPEYAAAVARARQFVRAAVVDQNLPGVSVAVGVASALSAKEGTIVWAEGFGWRDPGTHTPVRPKTRFNIGTAATVVSADAVKQLGLTSTGAEPASKWSPEAIGEPGEDFPPLTLIRHNVLQPLGLADSEYPLPGDRATFYVPRSDDNPQRGGRLMRMSDLACCAEKLAFYSTAADLVRVGLTSGARINGELAGGTVASLATRRDGIVVAVLSNIAHANTAALAQRIGDAFAR